MKMDRSSAARVALLAATSLTAVALAGPASAKGQGHIGDDSNRINAAEALRTIATNASRLTPTVKIITNDGPDITPAATGPNIAKRYANSAQVLDTSGVNGIGQMIYFNQHDPDAGPQGAFLGLCTGTLINPRAVITAAHCVDSYPAHFYGSDTGSGGGLYGGLAKAYGKTEGIPISFGFEATNRCQGIAVNGCAVGTGPYESWRDSNFTTNEDKAIYNGNQVWYHPNFTEFGLADVAMVTLDTHAKDIPTWTLLFSPLTGPEHVTITGYGSAGVGTTGVGDLAGIDYRRRSAENMLDALMSSHDWASSTAQGSYLGFVSYQHSNYWMDFDDPAYDPNNPTRPEDTAWGDDPAVPILDDDDDAVDFNWNINGLGGGALPREGTTGGGDSGGPLIVDEAFAKPVVVGVLTGGWSYNGGIGTYGEYSIYPPLFLFWQDIVRQNPYKYVSAKAGNGDWFDPSHWVQDMDPNYAILDAEGNLLTGVPNVAQLDPDSSAGRWGTNCFFETLCMNVEGTEYPTSNGPALVTAGGPGSVNFVPNNVEPKNTGSAKTHTWARYYDVTLHREGTTTLNRAATVDRLTVDGPAVLNIASTGSLTVLADMNQLNGWTNVNGTLTTGEMFMAGGILSGSGTIDPTYLTVVSGAVAPGGSGVGTLTVKGNMIMASQAGLLIDVTRSGSDLLNVVADADNAGALALNGSLLITGDKARYGDKFVVATAQGGISGNFASAGTSSGVLKPKLSYAGNQVNMTLEASSLAAAVSGTDKTVKAFAGALDTLRGSSYASLSNLYGSIDWMNGMQLSQTFSAMAPSIVGETQMLQDRQSRQLLGNVGDRLSLLGTGRAQGLSVSGNAGAFALARDGMSATAQLGLTTGSDQVSIPVAGGVSGFMTMGGDNVRSSYGDTRAMRAGQHNRYFASGIEAPFGNAMVGTAMGYAEATTNAGNDEATSRLTQAAAYATLPVGKSAYVGGIVSAERARTETDRIGTDATSMLRLSGSGQSSRYTATAEAGFRTGIGHGLSINPRAQLGMSRYAMSGLTERGGETALAINDLAVNRIETRFGARLDGVTKLGAWSVRPNIQADYVRLLSGADTGMNVSFAAAPDHRFLLPLTNSGSGWAELKGGVEMTKGKFTLGLSGQATAGDAPISDQRGAVDLTIRF